MNPSLLHIPDPEDYFKGIGQTPLPTPLNILFFLRQSRFSLQQRSPQNRSHHRCVLIINFKTSGLVHLDNRTLPLHPQEALLILPYQFHHYTHLRSPELQWLFCTFEIESQGFLEPLRNRVVPLSAGIQPLLNTLLTDRQTDSSEHHADRIQSGLLHLLIALKKRPPHSAASLPPEPEESLLRRINLLIMDQPRLSIDQLADSIRLSGSRLRTRFREIAGIPLGAYIRNYRINRAMSLLRRTNLRMAEIAEQTGFSSQQAFNRTFKKQTGQTPRNYRMNDTQNLPAR